MKKLAGILVLTASSGIAAAQDTASVPETTAFWTAGYAGPAQAALHCNAPEVPEVSQFNLRIRNVARAIGQWQDCYRRTMESLDPANAGRHIPAEALAAMAPAGRDAALRHVAAVHVRLADAIQRDAAPVFARHEAWREATVRYVALQNGIIRAGDAAVRRNEKLGRAMQTDEHLQRRNGAGPRVY